MPSFDVVSEIDMHEVTNAVDQANREVTTRFDFKGSGAKFEMNDKTVTLHGDADFQLKQMLDILRNKLSKRGVDLDCMEPGNVEHAGKQVRQNVTMKEGIDQALAKKIIKMIKDSKLKVQSQIQGEQVRITGKKRDDLQAAIALLKEASLEMPLQFTNFRD